MKISFLFLIFLLSFTPSVRADIVRCGEVWTNGSCDSEVGERLSEQQTEPIKRHVDHEAKRGIVSDLNTFLYDMRKKYDVKTDASYVEHLCLEQSSSLQDCEQEISQFEERVARRVAIAQEAQRAEEEAKNQKRDSSSQVIVLQENDHYVHLGRKRHRKKHPKHHHTDGEAARRMAEQILADDGSGAGDGSKPAAKTPERLPAKIVPGRVSKFKR